ncbi:MAG: DUF1292 domain-containing protein [Clostridia bacterium]|nr:DUF1292 domain-containing protein [Clostridia bacterium]
MEEERDLVVFSDDDGNEFELEVLDYFEYEGQEYAILVDPEPEDEDEDEALEVYIMKVVVNGDMEEFVPAEEDKMDELIKAAEERFACGCDCDDCDDCDCDDCDCEHDCDCEDCKD